MRMSRLKSLVFLWPRRVYGGSCKTLAFEGVKASCNVGLRGRRGTSWDSHVSANCKTCRKSFCVAGAILLHRFQKMRCSFVAGAALWRPPSSFCVASAALQTCRIACSTLHTLHSTLYNPHSIHSIHSIHFIHSINSIHSIHSTLHTLHSTLYTLHSTLYTLHSTLYTPPSTLYTPHFTLHTLHSTLTLYTPHFTL